MDSPLISILYKPIQPVAHSDLLWKQIKQDLSVCVIAVQIFSISRIYHFTQEGVGITGGETWKAAQIFSLMP